MANLRKDAPTKNHRDLPIAFPVKYSSLGTYINDADGKVIADVRGWGWIQKMDNPEKVQDGIGEFIAEAINEKAIMEII